MIEAERIDFNLPLDPISACHALSLGNATGPPETHWKGVSIPPRSDETRLDPFDFIYGKFSQEILTEKSLYKVQPNETIFRAVDRLKLIASILHARKENGGSL